MESKTGKQWRKMGKPKAGSLEKSIKSINFEQSWSQNKMRKDPNYSYHKRRVNHIVPTDIKRYV